MASFVWQIQYLLKCRVPGAGVAWFGHLGDGNLHFNVLCAPGTDASAFAQRQPEINRMAHDRVATAQGSISAEHGVEQIRRDENARYKSELELSLMRSAKAALDTRGLMNPGKVLPPG